MTLYKEPFSQSISSIPELKLSRTTLQIALTFLNSQSTLNDKSFQNQLTSLQMQLSNFDITKNSRNGKIGQIIPQIPPLVQNDDPTIMEFRMNLPVYKYRQNIIDTLSNNQICIITGETGWFVSF